MASRATQTDTGIDPQIAELLGLDFTADLDREDYISLLKERMMAGRMSSSKLSSEETELITDEFKRVKRDTRKTFKVKKTKISADSFKKQSPTAGAAQKALPGTGRGGALAIRKTKVDPGALVKSGGEEQEQSILEKILASVNSILGTLKEDQKSKKKIADQERRKGERSKRKGKEDKLESGIFKGLVKGVQKVLKPVEGILSRILKFIGTILIGKILQKIVDWMSDPKNEGKLEAIGDFLKNTWPLLLAAYLLFGNSLGRFATKLIGNVLKFSVTLLKKLIPGLLKGIKRLGLKKSLGVGALVVGGGMLAGRIFDGGEDDKQPAPGKDGADGKDGKDAPPKEMSKGGTVPGSGNKDTVPAMLTPGEYVMSKGAVQKYGKGTMESMNAMGGGSGIPSFSNGMMYASSGGEVPTNKEPGGRNKTKSDDEGGGLLGSIGKMFGLGKPPTIQSSPTKDDDKNKESGGGSLKNLTGQDFRDLAFIVSAEAQRGTDDEYGVSAAVLNRVADPAWPSTIKAVGSQAGQFEAVYKGLAKDDPELAAKLASPEGQAKIVEAMKKLKGRTDFKGTSQYENMGKGDIKFSNRGNFYHYKEQVGKNDPAPTPLPSYYTKFIGTGGPAVTLAGTTTSGGGGSVASSSGGGSASTKKKEGGGGFGGLLTLAKMQKISRGSSSSTSSSSSSTSSASLGSKPSPPTPPAPPTKAAPKVSVVNSGGASSGQQTPISETGSYVPSVPLSPTSPEKKAVLGIS